MKVKNSVDSLIEYKGKLSDGRKLLECLKQYEKIYRIVDKLLVYSSHKFEEDTTNQEFNAMCGKVKNYYSIFLSTTSFIEVEIMDIPLDKFEDNLKNVPELVDYKHFIESIIRKKNIRLMKMVKKY